MSKEKRFVFTGKNQVELQEYDLAPPAAGEIQIRTEASMVSSGTEGIVFARKFSAGNHWDNWVKYPFYPGYATAGTVAAVGENVTRFKVGDRVISRGNHASALNFPADCCYRIPDGISFEASLWFPFAKITAMGARVADYKLGDRVAVIGAGLIGQFSARWAYAAGAEKVIVVDPVRHRLDFFKGCGDFSLIPAPLGPEVYERLKEICGGVLPNKVVETTGAAPVFQSALKALAPFGRLVLMTDTGTPEEQRLCGEVITRGLHIVGAHDPHENGEWNSDIISGIFFGMCLDGRIKVGDMITHRFDCGQAEEIYRTCCEKREQVMGIVVNWK